MSEILVQTESEKYFDFVWFFDLMIPVLIKTDKLKLNLA